jgi:cyclic pyranopterin phosphate synthase
MQNREFTHFDQAGQARMVDVSHKSDTVRQAVAGGEVYMSAECFRLIGTASIAKGDVLGVARLAGIMAAKKVGDLIPLTHPLPITRADIDFNLAAERNCVEITATVGITGKTGVEMEALTAVSIAALTIYDMCKAVDKGMVIDNIRLLTKSGGKSGTYTRPEPR